jgi:hypothetical protein
MQLIGAARVLPGGRREEHDRERIAPQAPALPRKVDMLTRIASV